MMKKRMLSVIIACCVLLVTGCKDTEKETTKTDEVKKEDITINLEFDTDYMKVELTDNISIDGHCPTDGER